MNLKKALPAAIVVTLVTGAGLAHGAIFVSKQSHPSSPGSATPSVKSLDADSGFGGSLTHKRSSGQNNRLGEGRSDDRRVRSAAGWNKERDHRDFDSRDHESSIASLHHDGDDRRMELARADFNRDAHREASREIMHAAHLREAALFSPEHHSGYHARMHRHSR